MSILCLLLAFLVLLFPCESASVKEEQDVDIISLGAQIAQNALDFKVDVLANKFMDTIIQRFMRSPWFRAMVTPAFFVNGDIKINSFFTLKNVRIRGLDQAMKRFGDVTVKNEPSAKVLNVTLGPWQNLTIDADYVSGLSGRIGGSLSGSIPEVAVSFLAAVQGMNTLNFKVALRDFDVVDHGPFQLDALTGFWILSTPTRYIANMFIPSLQARALPLVEDKVKTIITMMLDDAQTLVLLRP